MRRIRDRLTYANVAATIALFLALSGGVVYAACRRARRTTSRELGSPEAVGLLCGKIREMRRRGRVVLAGLAVSVLLLGCGGRESSRQAPSGGPSAKKVIGNWRGEMSEKGLKPFRLRVRIASLGRASQNRYHYTGIDCSGVWKFLDRSDSAFRFRELYGGGGGPKCIPSGTVTLTPSGSGRLDFEYHGDGVTSRATLRRR